MRQVASWVNDIVKLASTVPENVQHSEKGLHFNGGDGGGGGRSEEGDGESATSQDADGNGGKRLRDAKTVAEFVPPLLALLPPAVKDLLTTFNAISTAEHALGQAQDGVVLQAIQGTEVYREVTRVERSSRCSRSDSVSSSGSGSAGQGQGQGHVVRASRPHLLPSPPPSPSCLRLSHDSECGCSSRHVLAIMTYALLLLLHERDISHRASGANGGDTDANANANGGADAGTQAVFFAGDVPQSVWRKDPLLLLPTDVVDEAKHVAGMLRGLVEMCGCEKCTTP